MKQELRWPQGEISLYEWSTLNLSDMLGRRPEAVLRGSDGQEILTRQPQMPRLVLADGASLSVQAGEGLYSIPRSSAARYSSVEVGFPSETPPDTWADFAEDWEHPTNTVYSYVPMTHVLLYIGAHGGIDRDKTFDGYEFALR